MEIEIDEITCNDLKVLTPRVFNDGRGYFFESFNEKRFEEETGRKFNWVQENESKSCSGVLRGLHYQMGNHAQTKLVRVIKGAVIDFVLDIDRNSPTYGNMSYVLLTEDNKKQFLVPNHYAHGFISLMDDTVFAYKCDNYYDKGSEAGYNIFRSDLDIINTLKMKIFNINWQNLEIDQLKLIEMLSNDTVITSEKDRLHPEF